MPLEAVQGDTGSLHGTDSLFERNSIQEGGEGDRWEEGGQGGKWEEGGQGGKWEEGESVGSSRCSTPVMIDPLQLEYSADPTNTVIPLLSTNTTIT